MRSAAAVFSEVWSHWPGRTDYQFQSQPLDASLKWIKTLHLPMVCDLGFLESVKRLHSVDGVLWKGVETFVIVSPAWFDCLNPLSFLWRSHSSPMVHSFSERIRWGVHFRGIRQSAYNSPPELWINQHWCKTIKSMRCGYLFILITLLHRAMHFGSFGVNALLKEDSEHRLPMPSLFHSMRAPSVSPEVVRQSTKAAIRRISNQTWAIRFFQHLLLSATSSGYHRGNESHWWRIWGNGMDR